MIPIEVETSIYDTNYSTLSRGVFYFLLDYCTYDKVENGVSIKHIN